MVAIRTDGPCDRIAFGREEDPRAQVEIAFVDGSGPGAGIFGHEDEARDAEERAKLVEIGAGGRSHHDRAAGFVHPLAQEQFAIGGDLQYLDRRIGVAELVEGGIARDEIGLHCSKDRFVIERLDDIGRGEAREIDSGRGGNGAGHRARLCAWPGRRAKRALLCERPLTTWSAG